MGCWVNRGYETVQGVSREGRQRSEATPKKVQNRRTKMCEIVNTVRISKEWARYILHGKLFMQSLCARWEPRIIIADKNEFGRHFPNNERRVLRNTREIFCVDMRQWMKHGVTLHTWIETTVSAVEVVLELRRRRSLSNRWENKEFALSFLAG